MTKSEELQIIQNVLKGQLADFEKLMVHYQQFSFTIAIRLLKDREEAEEACQDAFLKAYKQLAHFKQHAKFSTWLYTIVYRCALDRLNKNGLEYLEVEEDLAQNAIAETETAFDLMVAHEKSEMVRAGLLKMDGIEATVLTLYYLEELSLKEIAAIVQLKTNHLKVLLHRARKKLASILEKELLNHEIAHYGHGK